MLWDALSNAWNRLNSDRKIRALRAEHGWIGSIRRVEVTHGVNGWHVHAHVLEFWDAEVTEELLIEHEEACFEAWSSGLVRRGLAAPRRAVGTDLRLLDRANTAQDAAAYVTARATSTETIALELTDAVGGKSAKLSNRTPWQLLSGAMQGDTADAALWREWEQGSKGRRALLRSTGVREAYPALTDEVDVDAADETESELLSLTEELWVTLLDHGSPAELLAAAEDGFENADKLADVALVATVWDRLQVAQAAAVAYLENHGLVDGLIVADLDDERRWHERRALDLAHQEQERAVQAAQPPARTILKPLPWDSGEHRSAIGL